MIKGQPKIETTTSLVFIGDDEALANALAAGRPGAKEALYDRYVVYVRTLLVRILNTDVELNDHLHDVFLAAFSNTKSIKHKSRLKAWLTSVTINVAITYIRKNSKRRFFLSQSTLPLPEPEAVNSNFTEQKALSLVFELLTTMPPKNRVPFTLRYIEGMTLPEAASACGVSLATIKRRIKKGEQQFVRFVEKYPLLKEYMKEGTRWRGYDEETSNFHGETCYKIGRRTF